MKKKGIMVDSVCIKSKSENAAKARIKRVQQDKQLRKYRCDALGKARLPDYYGNLTKQIAKSWMPCRAIFVGERLLNVRVFLPHRAHRGFHIENIGVHLYVPYVKTPMCPMW